MAQVRSTGNASTEGRMVVLLRANKIAGWRRKVRLAGSPDFVWRHERVVIFVDGCFWHGCPRHGHVPRSRANYWEPKLDRNKARDRKVTRKLRRLGWRVIRVWEHELVRKNDPQLIQKILRGFRAKPERFG